MAKDDSDDSSKRWRSEWDEVQDHRYDPGYWLGGRIHPFYRKLAATGPTRSFGIGLCIAGLTTAAVAVLWRSSEFRLGLWVVSIVLVLLGISNIRAAAKRRSANN